MKAVFEAVDLLPRIVALTGPEFDGETTVQVRQPPTRGTCLPDPFTLVSPTAQEHALRVLLILSLGNSRECFSVASTHGVLALLRIVDRSVAQLKAASRDGAKSATCPNSLHLACTILGNLAAASVTVQQEMVEKGACCAAPAMHWCHTHTPHTHLLLPCPYRHHRGRGPGSGRAGAVRRTAGGAVGGPAPGDSGAGGGGRQLPGARPGDARRVGER